MAKRKYFPNNWHVIKQAPEEIFQQHTYEELMDWRVHNWTLPSSVCCIIRESNVKTGKVKEYVYQKPKAAQAKLDKLFAQEDLEITVCDYESIHQFVPNEFEGEDDLDDEDDWRTDA